MLGHGRALENALKGLFLAGFIAVRVSAYAPDPRCGQGDYRVGALGFEIRAGKTVAVSRDLKELLGREILLEGYGWRFVNDLMAPRFEKSVDVVRDDYGQALDHGVVKSRILDVN